MATKFSPSVCEIILSALRDNPSIPSAASKAGISAVTLNAWLRKGEEGVEMYQAFALDAQEARRVMKDEIVASLKEIALDPMHPQAVKASHLLLTNLFPAEFSVVRHTVSHKAEDPTIDLSKLSVAEKRQFHRTLKQIVSGEDGTAAITVIEASASKAEA